VTSKYTPEQHEKAAYAALRAGDGNEPEHIKATWKAQRDLIKRTWKSDRDMTRDERRLLSKYSKTLDAYDDERTAQYLTD
jgi:hypothetical protein